MQDIKQTLLSGKDYFHDVFGQEKAKHDIASALLAQRHVLIVGPAGVGKTTLAKSIAAILPPITVVADCPFHCTPEKRICPRCKNKKDQKTVSLRGENRFVRVQGSPDLTVEDLMGDIDPIKALQFGPLSMEAFTPGKIFQANNGILFFDELNRCPEKLQNALLQVLQEKKVTIGNYPIDIDAEFLFIATVNPTDSNTEKLSDVLLDRFDAVYMGYPENREREQQILEQCGKQILPVPKEIAYVITAFIRALRESKDLERKPSVRATLGLYERSQANALLRKKKQVELEDVQEAVLSVLAHRMTLKPALRYTQSPEEFVQKEFQTILKSDAGRACKEKKGDIP